MSKYPYLGEFIEEQEGADPQVIAKLIKHLVNSDLLLGIDGNGAERLSKINNAIQWVGTEILAE